MAAVASDTARVDSILEQWDTGSIHEAAAELRALEEEGPSEAEAAKLKEFENAITFLKYNDEQGRRAAELFADTEGWTEQLNDDVMEMYTKSVDAANIILKLSFEVRCSTIKFLAILNEVDLLHEVFGGNATFTLIREVSTVQKLLKSYTPMPWPVSARECYVTVYAMDTFADLGGLIVAAHSDQFYPDYADYQVPPEPRDAVRTQVPYSFAKITPIMNEAGTECVATRVELVRNQNMNSVVPNWLILWLVRTFARKMCASFKQKAENLQGTEHDARIASKPLYKQMDEKINRLLQTETQQTE